MTIDPKTQISDLIDVATAAELSGVTPIAIHKAMQRGRLDFIRVGRKNYTTKDALQFYWDNRKTGRPKNETT